jgi:hypothetical protein
MSRNLPEIRNLAGPDDDVNFEFFGLDSFSQALIFKEKVLSFHI